MEIRQGGQAFRLGRYAVHFHLNDVMNGSYVRHCAIHHSNNRAITAHGVHEMLFEGNVAYNIKGHTFFIVRLVSNGRSTVVVLNGNRMFFIRRTALKREITT